MLTDTTQALNGNGKQSSLSSIMLLKDQFKRGMHNSWIEGNKEWEGLSASGGRGVMVVGGESGWTNTAICLQFSPRSSPEALGEHSRGKKHLPLINNSTIFSTESHTLR